MPNPFSIRPLPFVEAIREAHARGVALPSAYYGELQGLARQLSFSIAGVTSLSQLEAVRDSLTEHMVAGGTFREWKELVRGDKVGLTLPAHRLDNIFRTNLQGNYMRGRCEAVQTHAAALPYLVYSAVNDSRTRPAHAAMHGHVAEVADPVWKTWMPPNGYRCRCTVIQVSAMQAARWAARDAVRVSRPGAAAERAEALSTGPDPGWGYTVCEEPDRGVLETMQAAGVKLQPALADKLTKIHEGAKAAELVAIKEAVATLNTELAKELGKEELDRAIAAANARAAALAAKAKEAELPLDLRKPLGMDRFRQVGPQAGSNEGGLYEDIHTGKKWYLKFPSSEAHARNEVLAARLYGMAGVEVPELRFVKDANGRLGVASPIVDGAVKDSYALMHEKLEGVHEGFAADAWLANWDSVGTGYDNMLRVGNRAVRIDTGGAMLFRAQGAPKGAAFGDVVSELDSLKDASINSYAAKVFKKTTLTQTRAGVKKILQITDDQIETAVDLYMWNSISVAERDALAATLKKRRDYLKKVLAPTRTRAPRVKAAEGDTFLSVDPKAVERVLQGDLDRFATHGEGSVTKYGIPVYEKAALTAYTGSYYSGWNRLLRAGTWNEWGVKKEDAAEAIKAAVNAIERLPVYSGAEVHRGQDLGNLTDPAAWVAAYSRPGTVIMHRGFTSTSYGSRAAFSGDVKITIRKVLSGRKVDDISIHESEREVLFPPGATFKVVSYQESGYTKYVELEEIEASRWDYTFGVKRPYPDTSNLPATRAKAIKTYWDRGYALEAKAEAASRGTGPDLTDEERAEYTLFRMTAETELAGFVVVQTPNDPLP